MAIKWFKQAQRMLLLSGLLCPIMLQQANADSLSEQRIRYQQIKQAWDNNQMDEVQRLMPTLKSYPLYPYLEYRQLTQNLSGLSSKEVNRFINAYPTLPLNNNLSRNFAAELARRADWKGLLSFVKQEPKAVVARCQYQYANWMAGNKQRAVTAVNEIWLNGKSLPSQCDPLFNAWRQAGHQTADIVLRRILLAAQAGKGSRGLVAYLVKQLPDDKKRLAEATIALQIKPVELVEFSKRFPVSSFTREVVMKSFPVLSRYNTSLAQALIPTFVKQQQLTADQRLILEKNVAGRLMNNDVSGKDAAWRDNIIKKSKDVGLMERRIRLALVSGNNNDLAVWLERLPAAAKQKDEWRYWQAHLWLNAKDKRADGEKILQDMMKQRGFYPMVAAQKLNKRYVVRALKANSEKQADKKILNRVEVARVKELLYWNLENQARAEWIRFVALFNKPEQELLARYAFDNGWADLSVQATIAGKLWDHLEERFPVAYSPLFDEALKDKAISKPFAMAIARQESAWNPQAQSPVGARGLMQLMPATAKETANRARLDNYKNVSQLLDPYMNIQLGTAYLDYVYQSFGNNRILAAASYNAGPHRTRAWLNNSAGRIDAVAFIESIPFTETRNYVKNVLSYDVFYGYFMQKQQAVLAKDELQRRY